MQQRSLQTRARLLDAALKCFARQGFNAASVESICAEAGVSKGAFYHHFPSKQALFLVLLEGWLTTIEGSLDAAHSERVPDTLLEMTDLLPLILETADERLPMFLEFMLQAIREEQVWQATIEPYHRFQEYFAALIRRGIAEGSFAGVDADAAARTLVSLAVGLLLQGVLDPQGADWGETARQGMRIFLKGLKQDNDE